MKRRTAVKGLVGISLGAITLPGCNSEPVPVFNNLRISSREYESLIELSDLILPMDPSLVSTGDKPADFILRMVDVCESPERREAYNNGLDIYTNSYRRSREVPPSDMSTADKKEYLITLEESEDLEDDLRSFYRMTKRYTLQHFTSSEYFLTNIMEYEFVPGRFIGCRAI